MEKPSIWNIKLPSTLQIPFPHRPARAAHIFRNLHRFGIFNVCIALIFSGCAITTNKVEDLVVHSFLAIILSLFGWILVLKFKDYQKVANIDALNVHSYNLEAKTAEIKAFLLFIETFHIKFEHMSVLDHAISVNIPTHEGLTLSQTYNFKFFNPRLDLVNGECSLLERKSIH